MKLENFGKLGENDVLKFVVDWNDLTTVEMIMKNIMRYIFISPIYFGKSN